MRHLALLLIGALAAGCAAGIPATGSALASPASTEASACAAPAEPYVRSTLYFGLLRPGGGEVGEGEWRAFLREEVTPRFPQGLTVWRVQGQWQGEDGRIDEESTMVLLLLHPDTLQNRAAIQAIREHYRKAFAQESVLWETAPACVAF